MSSLVLKPSGKFAIFPEIERLGSFEKSIEGCNIYHGGEIIAAMLKELARDELQERL